MKTLFGRSLVFRATVYTMVCCMAAVLLIRRLAAAGDDAIFVTPPSPTRIVSVSPPYSLPFLRGMSIVPNDPFAFEFLVDHGDRSRLNEEQVGQLINYFLAGLTTPDEDLWVNLSPDEEDRVLAQGMETTELGRDLLAQDYLLKQLASSLTHPDTPTGEAYWRVENGKSTIENRLGKIWIVPDKAEVYESGTTVVITEASLKLQCEDEAQQVLLPTITKDVNEGKNFAKLRQIYHSLILARWFKTKLRDSLYAAYIDAHKLKGIDTCDPALKEKIFALYVESFKKGVYDTIRSDSASDQFSILDSQFSKNRRRRFFSGGAHLAIESLSISSSSLKCRDLTDQRKGKLFESTVRFSVLGTAVTNANDPKERTSSALGRSVAKRLLYLARTVPVRSGMQVLTRAMREYITAYRQESWITGTVSDIALGKYYNYVRLTAPSSLPFLSPKDDDADYVIARQDGSAVNFYRGLENNVALTLGDTQVLVCDSHNYALPFIVVHSKAPLRLSMNLYDDHDDMLPGSVFSSQEFLRIEHAEARHRYLWSTTFINDWQRVLLAERYVDAGKWRWNSLGYVGGYDVIPMQSRLSADGTLEERRKLERPPLEAADVENIDIDFLIPVEIALFDVSRIRSDATIPPMIRSRLDERARAAARARIAIISTSPGYINQKRAIIYARYLVKKIAEYKGVSSSGLTPGGIDMGTIDVGGVEASSALDVGPGVLSRLEGLTFSLISLKPIEKPTSWISD